MNNGEGKIVELKFNPFYVFLINHNRQFNSSCVRGEMVCAFAVAHVISEFAQKSFESAKLEWVILWQMTSNLPKFSPSTILHYTID